jgi:hypothetical protein
MNNKGTWSKVKGAKVRAWTTIFVARARSRVPRVETKVRVLTWMRVLKVRKKFMAQAQMRILRVRENVHSADKLTSNFGDDPATRLIKALRESIIM